MDPGKCENGAVFSGGAASSVEWSLCCQKQWAGRGSSDVFLRGWEPGNELTGAGMLKVELVPSKF